MVGVRVEVGWEVVVMGRSDGDWGVAVVAMVMCVYHTNCYGYSDATYYI